MTQILSGKTHWDRDFILKGDLNVHEGCTNNHKIAKCSILILNFKVKCVLSPGLQILFSGRKKRVCLAHTISFESILFVKMKKCDAKMTIHTSPWIISRLQYLSKNNNKMCFFHHIVQLSCTHIQYRMVIILLPKNNWNNILFAFYYIAIHVFAPKSQYL